MFRIVMLVLSVCVGMTGSINAVAFSESSKQEYLDWLESLTGGTVGAMAVCPGKGWSSGAGFSADEAKRKALEICEEQHCGGTPCEIKDVDGRSKFAASKGRSSNEGLDTSSFALSNKDKEIYLEWIKKIWAGDISDPKEEHCWGECIGTLAVAPDGCWVKWPDKTRKMAKTKVLKKCKIECRSTECRVMDVDAQSAFIKKRKAPGGSISSSGTSASTGSSVVDDSAVEIEFWQTVKDSDDRDLLQAYLDEYPNGKFAPLARLKITKLKSD